jgi:protein NUD1
MDRPAWQTDELEEEWIEEEEDSLLSASRSNGSATSSISLTEAIGSLDITDRHGRSTGSVVSQGDDAGGTVPRGTFVVRDDVEAAPLMPKTPNAKVGFKGMFTPLALEKMFEPPSPPPPAPGPSISRQPSPMPAHPSPPVSAAPRLSTGLSPLSQTHLPVPTSIPTVQVTPSTSFVLNTSSSAPPPAPHPTISDATTTQVPSTEFTFSAPRTFTPSPFNPHHARGALAESTPGPSKHSPSQHLNIATPLPGHGSGPRLPQPPATDPRLRLFQFQYDTFTREHLSAILDNLPVQSGSPSTTNFSPNGSVPLSAGPVASTFTHMLSSSRLEHVGEVSADDQDFSASAGGSINRMRATKRVKLSLSDQSNTSADGEGSATISARTRPSNESYGEGAGAGAHIARPKNAPQDPQLLQAQAQAADKSTSRRDYVKESQAFMQQLKAHRDFSTVSTMSALGEGAEGSPTVSKGRYDGLLLETF